MARIENDVLILTEEEKEILRKNLLIPPENPWRDGLMKRIDSLLYEETDDGFVTTVDINVPENMFGEDEVIPC